MKKKILILAMVLAIITCIDSNKLTTNAMTLEQFADIVNIPVEEIKADPDWMACYYSGYHDDSICTYEEFMASLNESPNNNDMGATSNTAPVPAFISFDYNRYATENPDVAAVFGLNQDALYNHYTTCGAKEGRKAYYTDGTIIAAPGVAVLRPEMLDLVNAERTLYGAAPLVWDEELANHCLTRVIEVYNNYQNPEYLRALNNGESTGLYAHEGAIYAENARWNYSADTTAFASEHWNGSEGHHDERIYAENTKYACASYIDPVTGKEAWVEVFE